MHAGRTDNGTSGFTFRIEQPATQAGAKYVDITKGDRRSRLEAGQLRGLRRQPARDFRALDDFRQQPLGIGGAKQVENFWRIGARLILAEGEVGLRRIGAAIACQLEIQPVLAMKTSCGAGQNLWPVPGHPHQLHAHLTGIHAGSGAPVVRQIASMMGEILGNRSGARIEP